MNTTSTPINLLASVLVLGLIGCTDGASGCSGAPAAPTTSTTSTTTTTERVEEDEGTKVSVKVDEQGGALGVKTEEGDEVDIEVGDAKDPDR